MPMRASDSAIGCELSPRERECLDDMKARAGIASDADAIRTALYRFAVHLDVTVDTSMFRLRRVGHGNRRSANAR